MLFQYNPLNYYIETNADREIIVTIGRLETLAPRIRYNIKDEGGIIPHSRMEKLLAGSGYSLAGLYQAGRQQRIPLPFLFIFGRRDSTISVMGANIYPEDVEAAIFTDPNLSAVTNAFCMSLEEDAARNVRPRIDIELSRMESVEDLTQRFQEILHRELCRVNLDFRQAAQEYPEALVPIVCLYHLKEGPFQGNEGQIKRKYLRC